MNGIIFQGKSLNVGCIAKFLFEPEVSAKNVLAIVEFSTGEIAYAEILRKSISQVIVRIGDYYTRKGKRIREEIWALSYNQKKESWQLAESLN